MGLASITAAAADAKMHGKLQICRDTKVVGGADGLDVTIPAGVRFVATTGFDQYGHPDMDADHPWLEAILTEPSFIGAKDKCATGSAELLPNTKHLGLHVHDDRVFRESGLSIEASVARYKQKEADERKPTPPPPRLSDKPPSPDELAARVARDKAIEDAKHSSYKDLDGMAGLVATAAEDFK